MSEETVLTKVPNANELRAELEAMVLGDLLAICSDETAS